MPPERSTTRHAPVALARDIPPMQRTPFRREISRHLIGRLAERDLQDPQQPDDAGLSAP